MYESYFGLVERPFPSTPDVDHYFPAASSEAARLTLDRCLRRGEGAGLLVGAAGLGKTLLCRALAEMAREEFRVVMLSSGRIDNPRTLLQNILFQLGRPYRGMDEGELRIELCGFLGDERACPEPCLLLVDEAHWLKLSVLDEIRALTNLDAGSMPRVRVVLAGSSLLEEHLSNPRLDSLSQRIVARCYLEPMERDETIAFIRSQLKMRRATTRSPFTKDACVAVHRATGGVPRLINQLADHALLIAYRGESGEIDAAIVEEAWADLQQLPAPWQKNPWMPPAAGASSGASESGGAVIEFGGLEDDAAPAIETQGTAAVGDATAPPQAQASIEDMREPRAMVDVSGLPALEEGREEQPPMLDDTTENASPSEEDAIARLSQESSASPFAIEFGNPFEEAFEEEFVVPSGRSRQDAPGQGRAERHGLEEVAPPEAASEEPRQAETVEAVDRPAPTPAHDVTVSQIADLTSGSIEAGVSLIGGTPEIWSWHHSQTAMQSSTEAFTLIDFEIQGLSLPANRHEKPVEQPIAKAPAPAGRHVIPVGEPLGQPAVTKPEPNTVAKEEKQPPLVDDSDLAPVVLRPRQFDQLFSQLRKTS